MFCSYDIITITLKLQNKCSLERFKREARREQYSPNGAGDKKMKRNVNEYDFVRSFDEMNRGDNFSRAGRFALFEYLTDLEDDCGIEFELDVIGLCCDFSEYTLEEYNNAYDTQYTEDNYEEEISNNTILINYYDENKFIIQNW